MELLPLLTNLVTKYENRLQKVSEDIESLPKGTLVRYNRNGHPQYYQSLRTKDRERRVFIGKNMELVHKLCQKHYLEGERKLLEDNLKNLYKMKNRIYDDSPENIFELLPKRFATMPRELFLEDNDAVEYAKGNYERSNYMPEYLKHKTPLGFNARSKSEVIILMMLLKYNVKVHYEEVLRIDGHVFIPDFTIITEDGETIYWEHCGRTFDSKYMERHYKKLAEYASVGIGPWKNLIITYDDEDGNLDQTVIEKIIIMRILGK